MVNEQGGVNGRKIQLFSYDNGYNPAKTVEQVRKLVESDGDYLGARLNVPGCQLIQLLPELILAKAPSP